MINIFRILPLMGLLPFLEIIGFIVIGGRIGLWASLLWMAGAVLAGVLLLRLLTRPFHEVAADAARHMGSGALISEPCLLFAALLFMFPGFVSDILAVVCLVPPLRVVMFRHMNRKFADGRPPGADTIEGQFKRLDDTDKNNISHDEGRPR